MNLKEIIKSVRRIELKAKSFSNQNFSGLDQSASKGLGMNFSEVREYHLGDETRFIDWNVTARLNNAHVKVFEEEREHVNMFFIDISGSVDFGGGEMLDVKRQHGKSVLLPFGGNNAFSLEDGIITMKVDPVWLEDDSKPSDEDRPAGDTS